MRFTDELLLIGQSSEWLTVLIGTCAKSVLIIATAALLTFAFRKTSARLRHMLWSMALSSLLVLPLFSGWLQPVDLPILPSAIFTENIAAPPAMSAEPFSEEPAQSPAFPSQTVSQTSPSAEPDLPLLDVQSQLLAPTWPSVFLFVWMLGAALVLGRFLVGAVAVRRIVARGRELTDTDWTDLKRELSRSIGLRRRVRLLRGGSNVMPMTCLGAVVLLPNEADSWPIERRRAVVLHELIHVKRRDLLTLTLSQLVCGLYWFNPLVWWAIRRLRREQELACDEIVVATGVAASDYAEHLLGVARTFQANKLSTLTSTAMAHTSQLHERLCAILKPTRTHHHSARAIVVSMAIMSVVFVSTAVTRLVVADNQSRFIDAGLRAFAPQVELNETGPLLDKRESFIPDVTSAPVKQDDSALRQTPTPTPIDQPAIYTDSAIGDPMLNGFSAEESERLRSNGIGPAYIAQMREAGYNRLTVEQLIALFSNGIRADYVAGLRSVGYSGLSTSDLLSLKTNGVTPSVISAFQAVKHADFKATKYPSMLSNGVTPSYIRSLNDVGYNSLTANELVAMRLAGVTSEFIRGQGSRGHTDLSPNELIELKRRDKQ